MNLLAKQKTTILPDAQVKRRWVVFDAENQVLGRLSGRIVHHLRGKHKPDFSPHQECGDYVIVINAGKIKVTGGKEDKKVYNTHSGYTGGIKTVKLGQKIKDRPTYPLEVAVKRMLPKGRLGRQLFRNVHFYAESNHPHQSQKPVAL